MRTRYRLRLAAALACACVAACVSSPTPRYFTLDLTPAAETPSAYNIDVSRLRVAETLARPNLLIRKTPTEIEYYATAQWAGGLDEIIRHKLESAFGPHRPDRPTLLLSGTVLAFEQVDVPGGAEAHIRLDLVFHRSGPGRYNEPLLKKTYACAEPARAAEPAAVVAALSAGLERIAAAIAADADGL